MSAQTTYARLHPKGYPGLLADVNDADTISRAIETAAGAAFGIAVSRGTDGGKQAVIGSSDFLGITIRSLDREGTIASGNEILYKQNSSAAILRRGYIFAICPSGCSAGDPVNCATATGVLDAGAAGAGETQLDGATWESDAAAGELSVIHLETTATTAGS